MLAPLHTILSHDPPASDHDCAQAYSSLAEHLRSIKHGHSTDALLPHLEVHFPRLAKSLQRDICYAVDHKKWLEQEGLLEEEMDGFEQSEGSFGAALRCYKALHVLDALFRFYDRILVGHDEHVLRLFQDVCAIVASTAFYYEQEDIRPQAAYILRGRLCILPAALLEELYKSYTVTVLTVLQNEKYVQSDNDVVHYCVLSIGNIIAAYPSIALSHLAPLLPDLYPLLTLPHTTLRMRAAQVISCLTHAYVFSPTLETSSVSFERALAAPLRDWVKIQAKLRSTSGDTLWMRLRESKRGGGTWAFRVCAAFLVLLGRRVWWLPDALNMFTFPVRPERPRTSASASFTSSNNSATLSTAPAPVTEDVNDNGPTRAELTVDIYHLLAYTFARMRLWQQDHGVAVSHIDKESKKKMSIADIALEVVHKNWPSPAPPSTPEPHQQSSSSSPHTSDVYAAVSAFVPAVLWALGPKANDEDRVWNIKAAIGLILRMLQDGAREGEEMLAHILGAIKDGAGDDDMDCGGERVDKETALREAVLGRLLSRRAFEQPKAPVERPVGAGDVRTLKAGDIEVHWRSLVGCWALLLQRNPYSENVMPIFETLLCSSVSTNQKLRLLDILPTHVSLPACREACMYDLLARFWELALGRIGLDTLKPAARTLLRALLTAPPSAAEDTNAGTAWACLACILPADHLREESCTIEKVVHEMAAISTMSASHALRLATALARIVPLTGDCTTTSLELISRVLEAEYDAAHLSPSAFIADSVAAQSQVDSSPTPAFSIFSAICTNIISRGISVRSALTLAPGLGAWIGDERRVISNEVYNAEIVQVFEALLEHIEPSNDVAADNDGPIHSASNVPELLTLSDLTSLAPLLSGAFARLPPPGHAADVLWAFWTRVGGRLKLKGDEYPSAIQSVVSALCIFLGHEVPEGMETQEDELDMEVAGMEVVEMAGGGQDGAGTPSIHVSQARIGPTGSQTQGQTSSALYWAAQSSIPSRLLRTQPPVSVDAAQPAFPLLASELQPMALQNQSLLLQLAASVNPLQGALSNGDEQEYPPAKRRRLSPDAEDRPHAPFSGRHQASTSTSHLVHPHTASSRSRKSHLPTPEPSEEAQSSPILELAGLKADDEEEEGEQDWDGDEGMMVDSDGEEGEESVGHASGSERCARGEAEDVPGVAYGGSHVSRSSFLGRYTYSVRQRDEDEVVPATPDVDDDEDNSAVFFKSKRKRAASSPSSPLTFNLSYSYAGSTHAPAHHPYSPSQGRSPDGASPSAHFSYSERGSIDILRSLPRGKPLTGPKASGQHAQIEWDEDAGGIPGFGGGDMLMSEIGDTQAVTQGSRGPQNDGAASHSARFSYSERGSLEILRNLPLGQAGARTGPSRPYSARIDWDGGSGEIPGLGGKMPAPGEDADCEEIPGLGIGGANPAGASSASGDIPSLQDLVVAIDTIDAFVERAPWDEGARVQLERLRGIQERGLARLGE